MHISYIIMWNKGKTHICQLNCVFGLQIISLGSHSIDADFEQAVLLMEIMPSLLAKRHFDPLNTLAQLEPGYRDSPEPDEDMAIMFVKVSHSTVLSTPLSTP